MNPNSDQEFLNKPQEYIPAYGRGEAQLMAYVQSLKKPLIQFNQPTTDVVIPQLPDAELLGDPNFWKFVFAHTSSDDDLRINTLIYEVWNILGEKFFDVADLFYSHPNFHISLFLGVRGRGRSLSSEQKSHVCYIAGIESVTTKTGERSATIYIGLTWQDFSSEEVKSFIGRAIEQGAFESLFRHQEFFIDTKISRAEYYAMLRAGLLGQPDAVAGLLRRGPHGFYNELSSVLSISDLRAVVEAEKDGRPLYADLNYHLIRKFELTEAQRELWMQYQERDEIECARQQTALNKKFGFNMVVQPVNSKLDRFIEAYSDMSPPERAWLFALIPKCAGYFLPEWQEFYEKEFFHIVTTCSEPHVSTLMLSIMNLSRCRCKLSVDELIQHIIRPVVRMCGDGASVVIDKLTDSTSRGQMINLMCPDVGSARVLQHIISLLGTRAPDFFSFYRESFFHPIVDEEDFEHIMGWELKEERPLRTQRILVDFLSVRLPLESDLFKMFEIDVTNGVSIEMAAKNVTQRAAQAIALVRKGDEAAKESDEGEENDQDRLGTSMLTHVFPPAMSFDRDIYLEIIKRRADRQQDVPQEWNDLQETHMTFSTGMWSVRKGEQFNPEVWRGFIRKIYLIHGKRIVADKDTPEAGEFSISTANKLGIIEQAISLLKTKNAMSASEVVAFCYAMYVHRAGVQLPLVVNDREAGKQIYEWQLDQFREIISELIAHYRQHRPEDFDRLCKELSGEKNTQAHNAEKLRASKIIKSIIAISSMATDEKVKRVSDVLGRFSFQTSIENVQIAISACEKIGPSVFDSTIHALMDSVEIVKAGALTIATELPMRIVQNVLGDDGFMMRQELEKWEFIKTSAGDQKTSVSAVISKRRLHAAVGLHMGVCVAIDDELWNKPDFSNVILFNEQNIAEGGMHLEIIRDETGIFVSLPGINPSSALLKKVDPLILVHKMLDLAAECARRIGARGILIPTNSEIFSNRGDVHGVVQSMNLQKHLLSKKHQFSYSPSYSWQEAYFIEASDS